MSSIQVIWGLETGMVMDSTPKKVVVVATRLLEVLHLDSGAVLNCCV